MIDISHGSTLRQMHLPPKFFAEGIAVFPDQIIQLTWRERQAFVYERSTLKLRKVLFYEGEGWGLCRDENTVWMSNGTSEIIQRDLLSFAPLRTLQVHIEGKNIDHLNDLECVKNHIYANIWKQNQIIRIDKSTGQVDGIADMSFLLSHLKQTELGPEDVLNGIAFRPKTGTFFLQAKVGPGFLKCISLHHIFLSKRFESRFD